MEDKRSNYIALAAALAALGALLVCSQAALESARAGLTLCAQMIVPSLLPFFMLSSLLQQLGLPGILGKLLSPVTQRLFGIGGASAFNLSMGRGETVLTLAEAQVVAQRSANRYARDGDSHYDILSAFQKSVRGSDPDAAVHYLARLLEAGDLISPCRRLMVMASEDVGLAYPQAVAVVKACVDSANMLGLPEARIPLAQAAIFLATAPKSNSAILAVEGALADLRAGRTGEVPPHLRDAHYEGAAQLGHGTGYQYAHGYPNHYVKQQYLPDALKNQTYYTYGENKTEQAAKQYWDRIKGEG